MFKSSADTMFFHLCLSLPFFYSPEKLAEHIHLEPYLSLLNLNVLHTPRWGPALRLCGSDMSRGVACIWNWKSPDGSWGLVSVVWCFETQLSGKITHTVKFILVLSTSARFLDHSELAMQCSTVVQYKHIYNPKEALYHLTFFLL